MAFRHPHPCEGGGLWNWTTSRSSTAHVGAVVFAIWPLIYGDTPASTKHGQTA
jgi:hypothetical protein